MKRFHGKILKMRKRPRSAAKIEKLTRRRIRRIAIEEREAYNGNTN